MKIVLRLDAASNGFVIAEGPEGVAIKSRCENSMSPNLILVEVPENALDPELVASLRQRIDDLEKDINADSDALTNLAAQFKEVTDERDTLKATVAKLELELDDTHGVKAVDPGESDPANWGLSVREQGERSEKPLPPHLAPDFEGETQPEEIITTQFEAKEEDKG
jgi:hypothetical protein